MLSPEQKCNAQKMQRQRGLVFSEISLLLPSVGQDSSCIRGRLLARANGCTDTIFFAPFQRQNRFKELA